MIPGHLIYPTNLYFSVYPADLDKNDELTITNHRQ